MAAEQARLAAEAEAQAEDDKKEVPSKDKKGEIHTPTPDSFLDGFGVCLSDLNGLKR